MPVKIAKLLKAHTPRILIFDIETTPMKSWHWRVYDENISPKQIIEFSRVLCFAAKWLGNDSLVFESTKGKTGPRADREVCKSLWGLFDEAEIVVAHNGKAFDVDTMRARFAYFKMPPPSPFKIFDTLRLGRGMFRFPSNKLDAIARYLKIGRKVEHEGFDLWLKCMAGNADAWKRMETYNIGDVLLLEEVYTRLRCWSNTHPNVALLHDEGEMRCVCCGAAALKELTKASYTAASVFPSYRCRKCGKVMRGRKRDKRNGELLAHSM
jgi:uncharacterized Zn finger protein